MGCTTAAKMLSGIVVFIVMARLLGPYNFGIVAYSFTLASVFVLITDYGYSQQLLKDVSTEPKETSKLVGRAIVSKLFLTSITLFLSLIYSYITSMDQSLKLVFFLLLISCFFVSFSEVLNVPLRGLGMYRIETNIATVGSVLHFIILISITFWKQDIIWIGYAFVISRALFFLMSLRKYYEHIGFLTFSVNSNEIWRSVKNGFPYAVDSMFTNLFYQIDTFIIKIYMGVESVGLYQAATKWLQGGMQFAPVLANVYLPALSANVINKEVNSTYAKNLNKQMIAIGFAGWVFFTFFGVYVNTFFYGIKYNSLNDIWPYVGLLMFVRYVAGSQGVLLVAQGRQKIRVAGQLLSFILFCAISPFLVSEKGLPGVLISLSLSIFVLFIVFMVDLLRSKAPTGYTLSMSLFITTIILLSLFFITN